MEKILEITISLKIPKQNFNMKQALKKKIL